MSHESELVYFGSTSQSLSQRMAGHRASYKHYLAGKYHWVSSFELLKLSDAYIELVRVIEYTVKAELNAVEGEYIRENTCVNNNQAGRTSAKYYVDHKDKINEYNTGYRIANAEKLALKACAKHTCECGGKFTTQKKAQHLRTAKHIKFLAK